MKRKIGFQMVRMKLLQASAWSPSVPSGHAGSHSVGLATTQRCAVQVPPMYSLFICFWVVGRAQVLSARH